MWPLFGLRKVYQYVKSLNLMIYLSFDSMKSEIVHRSIQVVPSFSVASEDQEVKITSSYNFYKFTRPGYQESRKYTAAAVNLA